MTPFRQQHRQPRLCFVKTSVHDRIQSISKFTDKLLNSSGSRYWFKLFNHYPNNLSLVFLRATHTFLSPASEKDCKIYCDHHINLSFIFFLLQTDLLISLMLLWVQILQERLYSKWKTRFLRRYKTVTSRCSQEHSESDQ